MITFLALDGWNVDIPNRRLAQRILDFATGASPDALADELRRGLSPRP